jgi:uncharacterized protein (TIGR01777 family)
VARFTLRTPLPVSPEALFAWHARPSAFDRLVPPFDPVEIVARTGSGLEVGSRVTLRTKVGPVSVSWVSVHTACTPPSGFVDRQEQGPFAAWEHHHRFLPAEDGGAGSVLEDDIHWEAPLGALGRAAAPWAVEGRLARAFAFRHRRTAQDLARHQGVRPRRVAITGATGLVGSELAAFLGGAGHDVVPVSRRAGLRWDPDRGEIDAAGFEGVEAVVHLAGESVGTEPWTAERKARITASRVDSTTLLCRTLAGLTHKPKVLISASAVGYYGDAGEVAVDESSPRGEGFLADVCEAWEAPTRIAAEAGIRVVNLRIGIVMSARGAALAEMLPVFRAGAGGPLGSGAQYQPWVHLEDLVGAIGFLLDAEDLHGPVNATSPNPVRQADFAAALGAALSRPAVIPAPRFALHLLLGRQKADELVFFSQRARPSKLQAAGFRWFHPEIGPALAFELGA